MAGDINEEFYSKKDNQYGPVRLALQESLKGDWLTLEKEFKGKYTTEKTRSPLQVQISKIMKEDNAVKDIIIGN